MFLLPCPDCQATIPVAPSQAGDTTRCSACQQEVAIPKLGDLRKLPQAEPDDSDRRDGRGAPQGVERSVGHHAAFLVLALIATGALLIAGYCGIRWSLVEVPATTEKHISMLREEYQSVPAAQLIREYEQMERDGLDLGLPYGYKTLGLEKEKWGNNASIAGGIGALALLGAFGFAVVGRKGRS